MTGSRQRQHARRFERWRWELISRWEQAAISWRWRRGWELGTYGSPRLRRQFCRKPRRVAKSSAGLSVLHLMTRSVVTVSRLAPQKNLGMVLDIASAVRDRPDLRFVVVGEGPEHQKLQRRITSDRLQVALLGRSDDIAFIAWGR